jgi:hypothetical protein
MRKPKRRPSSKGEGDNSAQAQPAATLEPTAPPATAPATSPETTLDTFVAKGSEPAQAVPVNLPAQNLVLPAPSANASEITPAVALEILAQTHDVATWLGSADKEIGYELHRIASLAAGLIERMQRQ